MRRIELIAHLAENGRVHGLEEHLRSTAERVEHGRARIETWARDG